MEITVLSKGKTFTILFDDADWPLVAQYKWRIYQNRSPRYPRYALAHYGRSSLRMHRLILGGAANGFDIDHRNGNGLDNRRENLRICTRAQNLANMKIKANNRSGFKGVTRDYRRPGGPWIARIKVDGETKRLGRFATPEEAHAAYCSAAVRERGEFARFE